MNQPLTTQQVPTQPGRNLGQIIANLGQQSALAKQSTVDSRALAAGIKPSFAVITFKGKTWGIRHRGITHQLLVRDPQTGQVLGSVPTIDVVVIKSATAISKTYYIDKYKENDFKQPDCWSTNGVAPDAAASKKQSPTCRGCQWDAFGSRTMDDGRKGKACQDNKRTAVVPAADLKNEAFGGPMLLRLPPSSFNGLSELEAQLHQQGYNYYALVMRLSFDHEAAFPKIIFTPIAVLNDYQMQEVLNLQGQEIVDRILNEELIEVTGDPGQPVEQQPQPTPAPAPQPQPQPQQMAQPVVQVQPPPAPVAAPVVQAFNPVAPQPAQPQPVGVAATAFQTPATGPATGPAQAQPGPVQGNADGLDIPPMLRRSNGQAAPAAAPVAQPQPAPAQQVETPEQKIARLEAALAAASAPKPRKPRTSPVTPAGNQPAAQATQPAPQPAVQQGVIQPLPLTTAAPIQPSDAAQTTAGDDDEGDVPADLDQRINSLLNPGG